MFNQKISYFGSFSREFANSIAGHSIEGPDNSLVMTATALLYQRTNNLKIGITKERISENIPYIISKDPTEFTFHWIEGCSESPDKYFKEGIKLPVQEEYIKKEVQPVFFRVLPDVNTVCIFTTEINLKIWHVVQFLIPKFFSVFKDKPLTKEETEFLLTLTQRRHENYITKLSQLINTAAFQTFCLADKLNNIEWKMYEGKITKAKNQLAEIEKSMESAMETYRTECIKRQNIVTVICGLETVRDQKSEESELKDYIVNNQRLTNIDISGTIIKYIVKTELVPYLTDEWSILSKNTRWISSIDSPFSKEETKMLLDAIFSEDRSLKLRMCAVFHLDYFGSSVESVRYFDYISANAELANYIPNPHLNMHNCFAQNKTAILNQVGNGDIVGAIECSIACAQRVNINEEFTFKPFATNILKSKRKCLVTFDGKELTPVEALEYLRGKENE